MIKLLGPFLALAAMSAMRCVLFAELEDSISFI